MLDRRLETRQLSHFAMGSYFLCGALTVLLGVSPAKAEPQPAPPPTPNGASTAQGGGTWKVPGEIRQPTGHWQVPGEIQQPKGPWRKPGELQVPSEIRSVVIADRSACERSLSLGADTLFEFDKFALTTDGERSVDALGKLIAEHHPTAVTIKGHTDSKGSDEYNRTLSEKRARTVADRLKHDEVLPKSVTVLGAGEQEPVAPNARPDGSDDPEGRAKNRRVEVVLMACESKH